MTTTGESSDETSSSCFPPKASIEGHNMSDYEGFTCASSVDANHKHVSHCQSSCPQMWEGSSTDPNLVRRQSPTLTTTTSNQSPPPPNDDDPPSTSPVTPSLLFAKSTDEVVCLRFNSGERQPTSRENTASSAPGASSRSSSESGHCITGHCWTNASSSVATATPFSALQQQQQQHQSEGESDPTSCGGVPIDQLMKLLSESASNNNTDESSNNTILNNTIVTTVGSRGISRVVPPHQPQFSLSSSAVPFQPKTQQLQDKQQSVTRGTGKKRNQQAQEQHLSPQSSASAAFSVTSFNEGEQPYIDPAPVDSPDTRNLQKVGCQFIAVPFGSAKSEPVLARLSPGENTAVKEVFIGQLPFDFNPAVLCDTLRRLVAFPTEAASALTTTSSNSIVTRFKMGPKPTCAFLTVREQYEAPLLGLSQRILCDNNGLWIAYSDAAIQGLESVSKRRTSMKKPGIPQRPMVFESVNQVSHAPKVQFSHGPPIYPPQQQQFGMGGSRANPQFFAPQFSAPPLHYSEGSHSQQHHRGQQPVNAMSVCLCGASHVVAMTHHYGSCSMCARDLPSGVMVRRCPNCMGTDICHVCVGMANSSSGGGAPNQHHQQHNVTNRGHLQQHQAQNYLTNAIGPVMTLNNNTSSPPHSLQATSSAHHQFSQRHYLLDDDHVAY